MRLLGALSFYAPTWRSTAVYGRRRARGRGYQQGCENNGRLPQNCIERQQYPQGPVMQFFAMTILILFVILSKAKDLEDSTTINNSTAANSL